MAIADPIALNFRGATDRQWRVAALVVRDRGMAPPVVRSPNPDVRFEVSPIAQVPLFNPTRTVYRCEVFAPRDAGVVQIGIDESTVSFAVPPANGMPRVAYASCNGFSQPRAMKGIAIKNERWQHLLDSHSRANYHLLLLGGDQVYADELWSTNGPLSDWTDLPKQRRLSKAWSRSLREDVDRFYCNLYLNRWQQPEIHLTLTSIPSIMMWDDHDIFDGWGSYEEDLHRCDVYRGVFEIARNYFRIFQQQLADGESHPAKIPGQSAFNMGFSGFGELAILALDLRSERRPDFFKVNPPAPSQVISQETANAIYQWLDQASGHRHLLVMSSIPVSYLDLGFLEKMLCALPGQQELEDDLRDHWRSESHLQERKRLVHRLLSHATHAERPCRITILSGDVHVAAASLIESDRSEHRGTGRIIHQLISSAIVHPGPPGLVRYVLESIADRIEHLDPGITATMQPMGSKGARLIGERNWLALEPDRNGALWANWHVEGMISPITKVIHPAVIET